MNLEESVTEFITIMPEFEDVLYEHIEFNEELLGHIFYGETINYVLQGMLHEHHRHEERLIQLFDFFERMATEGDHYLQELLTVTILEWLGEDIEALHIAYRYMGKRTQLFSSEIQQFWNRPT